MTRPESQSPERQTVTIPTDHELIRELIRVRWMLAQWSKKPVEGSPVKILTKPIPTLMNLPSLDLLFKSRDLWMDVDGVSFIPYGIIKSLLVRADGTQNEEGSFTVAIAMRRESIRKHWNIEPLTVWDKQRSQYWDEPFARIFLASIQQDETHKFIHFNKVAYRIRPDVSHAELEAIKLTEEANHVFLIRTSYLPVYKRIRGRWKLPILPRPRR